MFKVFLFYIIFLLIGGYKTEEFNTIEKVEELFKSTNCVGQDNAYISTNKQILSIKQLEVFVNEVRRETKSINKREMIYITKLFLVTNQLG